GAPLEVPATTNYVTCNHCGSKLVIRRGESATYTELAGAIDQMAGQLAHLVHEQELERIDREWEEERQQYMIENKQGFRSVPNTTSSVVGGVAVTGFGILWTAMAFAMTSGFSGFGGPFDAIGVCFPLFGVVFVLIGIGVSVASYRKAQAYQEAYQ